MRRDGPVPGGVAVGVFEDVRQDPAMSAVIGKLPKTLLRRRR